MNGELFVMSVIRVDGEVIGTGWIGKKVAVALLDDQKKLIKVLRNMGAIPPRVRPTIGTYDGETIIRYSGDIQLVLRTN